MRRPIAKKALVPPVVALILLCELLAISVGSAAPLVTSLPRAAATQVDWQYPEQLPRQFRNHCAIQAYSGRPYCSNHCGFDYAFYHCSPYSFGCCRIGFGYCDWSGLLRCAP
jgi:hypothetical protein